MCPSVLLTPWGTVKSGSVFRSRDGRLTTVEGIFTCQSIHVLCCRPTHCSEIIDEAILLQGMVAKGSPGKKLHSTGFNK